MLKKEDSFFLKAPDIQLEFTRDEKESIEVYLHQRGAKIPCKKIK